MISNQFSEKEKLIYKILIDMSEKYYKEILGKKQFKEILRCGS